MQQRDDLDNFYKIIDKSLFQLDNEKFSKYFEKIYKNGQNKIYQKNLSETKKFNSEWVKTIESYLPSIDRIINSPRSSIKYDDDVVEIEKAKKISTKSVSYLASHSNLVKTIEDDDVVPKKILTISSDQDYGIYENRFISTLVNRLFLFVRNRYLIIKENVNSYQKDHIYTESSYAIEDIDVNLNIDVTFIKDLDDKQINIENNKVLERVEKIEKIIETFKRSNFMRSMSKYGVVRPPIIKTNIILKNPDFKNAYNLWIFLDRYSTLTYDVDVKEKSIRFDNNFDDHIRKLNLITLSTILGDKISRSTLFNCDDGKTYTKKSSKQLRSNADDFVDNPNIIQIEDTTLNEYFLNKYKQLFNESLEEIKEEGKTSDDEALRRALKKTTEIVNGLYDNIFNFEEEKNITNYLITEKDDEKELAKYQSQLKYAKIIREIKELDYNQSMRREKKLLNEIEKLNKRIIKLKKEEIKKNTDNQYLDKLRVDIDEKQKERSSINEQLSIIEDNKTMLESEKDSLNAFRNELLSQVKVEVENFKNSYKEEIENERINLKKQSQTLDKELKELTKKLNELKKYKDNLYKERLLKEKKAAMDKARENKKNIKESLDKKRKDRNFALQELIEKQKLRLSELKSSINSTSDDIKKEKELLNAISKESENENTK